MNGLPSQAGKLHIYLNVFDKGKSVNELRGSPQDWLTTGWILEIPRGFLIGGGYLKPMTFDELERASCAVWAPGFFADVFQSIDRPAGPMETVWSEKITREALISWLTSSTLGSISGPAMSKISWRPPSKEKFQKAFERLQTAFREDGVKKAVPAVFATGIGATTDRREWVLDRIRAGIAATSQNDLRLYGMWSELGGFIGATPEALFTRELDKVTSMAVAGTRAVRSLGDRKNDPAAIAKLTRDFLNDPKERNEHEIVLRDIASVLETAGAKVKKSATGVERFGALFHLVTHVNAEFPNEMKIRDLVTALHPTPALGVSPRDPELKLLRELHEICGEGVGREGWGAPFVVKSEERVEAVVAIRQLRWTFTDNDRIRVVVGSGCGVVPESDIEREWNELEAKRRTVMRQFRLTIENPQPVLWSLALLERLLVFGVRKFIVCAGARNAPLVVAIEALRQASSDQISIESFFEERAGAFYALGRARKSGEPVAILTTSGTAVTEIQAALAEADLSGVPLIAVTADRPRRLRDSGAPQSIPQNGIFDRFVERSWDLEEGDVIDGLDDVSRLRPLHINACLEEPLLIDIERAPELLAIHARHASLRIKSSRESSFREPSLSVSVGHSMAYAVLGDLLAKRSAMVAVVGSLRAEDRAAVANFIAAHSIPCLLEGPSGLRGDVRLKNLELRAGDRDLQEWCRSGELGAVLRLGGVPTTRTWRDLDEVNVVAQALSISQLRFSGLSRGQFIQLPAPGEFSAFIKGATPTTSVSCTAIEEKWLANDRISSERLQAVLSRLPNSEPEYVRKISNLISPDALVYVGNSLPIRWWDLTASREHPFAVEANRGVNGIDGQLSTALGLAADSNRDAWIILGDLTALYDLAAPWALSSDSFKDFQTRGLKLRIFVINNSGGRIFSRVLGNAPGGSAIFENRHDLHFDKWAEMWSLDYQRVESSEKLNEKLNLAAAISIIEIIPSAEETAAFWLEY